jgi:arylsulfatase A-like enzyme
VFAEPILHDRARYRQGRGVVVVSIDTLRRDHMSLYGYPRKTTPGLEALASESVVFDDAVSTSSWTLPAHASLLTSTYPSVHGAVNLNVGLSPAWPRISTLLQEAEFVTQAIVTHVYLSTDYGFGEGFDRHAYLPETRAEEVTNRAIRFLTSMGDRDFFLFVHYYDPHWHYDPPAPYHESFDPSYEGEASGVWWEFKELDRDSIDPRDLGHIEALYDGEILYTDRHVERLVRAMKELEIFDKSMIVVTSDHGEEFLEHGSWEHQKTLYEEQLRIPLVIKYPGGEGAGRRVAEQVSLIDVAPTIADVMELALPPTFQGVSLRRDVEAGRELWSETEHTIDGTHKLSLRRGARAGKAIFSMSEDGVAAELFDLGDDPVELEPVSDEAMHERVEGRLEDYLARAAAAREGKAETPSVDLDPEERERLRALGYIQ